MIGLIIGPQGSGKGTQAELICKDFGFLHTSMGDLLRAETKKNNAKGNLIKDLQKKGELVPTKITNDLAEEVLKKEKNVLLDGYPRSEDQAEYLLSLHKIDFAIVIEISEDETIKRLEKRRMCTATNKILISDKITEQDISECKKLGGEIIQREDDKPKAILERLNIYHKETKPLLKKYISQNVKIIKINGEQEVSKVYSEIKKELEKIIN
ncbi:adenylate kinase [Candidatus Woesearchaeota archaeon CG10_big_fil_rev_8_21_14_0_10_32_9]|nr:MAG: adenylate kinase [Candidatus Woesearchaeota archaeon CG10_big_fil_rev_8_21_14_0_10_32_9]